MNSNNAPLLTEAFDGLASFSASDLVSSHFDRVAELSVKDRNVLLAHSGGRKFDLGTYFLKRSSFYSRFRNMLMFCAFCGAFVAVQGEDITEDVIKEGESGIAGLEYSGNIELGAISSTVSGQASSSTAYGIYGTNDILIQKIGKDAVISAQVNNNNAYAIYSDTGHITIVDPLEGRIVASGAGTSSKQIYGINAYAYNVDEARNVTLGGIAETGSIEVKAKKGYASAIYASGAITINGDILGRLSADAGTAVGSRQAYTVWAKKGGISIRSIKETSSITATGLNASYAFYAQGDFTVQNEIAGEISAYASANGAAYAIISDTLSSITSDIRIGSIASTASLSAIREGIYAGESIALYAKNGKVTVENGMDGSLAAKSSGGTAYGIKASKDVTLGDMGSSSSIVVESTGTTAATSGAYGIWAGVEPDGSLFLVDLTIDSLAGKIRATSTVGNALGLYSRTDVNLGNMSDGAIISATSTEGGSVYGVWGNGGVNIKQMDGEISATTTGNTAYGIVGLGLDVTIGATGSVLASGAENSDSVYALYSGCYQNVSYGKSAFITYNIPDMITLYGGSQLKGIIELGGSGETGKKDTLNLLGGSAEEKGLFDYVVKTTINERVTNPPADNQYSFVQLNIGAENAPAYWELKGQSSLFNEIRINPASVVTVNDASLSPRAGGSVLNMGMIEGTGTLTITGDMSFTTGVLGMDDSYKGLVIRSTGLGKDISLTIQKGASLGTSVVNTSDNAWVITESQISVARDELFSQLIGSGYSTDDYTFTYFLKGQVYLGNGTPVEVKPGTGFVVGEGAEVTLGENLPTNGFVLDGGMVDVSRSLPQLNASTHNISGSSGMLVMGGNQELVLDQSQEIGYSIRAQGTSAGKLTVTGADNTVHATGNYDVKKVDIVNRATFALEGGSLGSSDEGALIQVGAEYASSNNPASLMLKNATVKSELSVGANSLLAGSGTFEEKVNLFSSKVHVGNSPGVMNFTGGLNLQGVSDLTFYMEGTGAGAYSMMNVGTSLDWQFSHVNVELGDKLFSSDSKEFSLILVDASAAETVTGMEEGQSLEITKNKEFLTDYSLEWNSGAQQLIFSGTLNSQIVNEMKTVEGAALANALWSSTRSVNNFARVARAQLNGSRSGKSNIWVAGLGDFSSAGNDGSIEGFDYQGGGYALGADYVLHKNWMGGISLGQTFGTNESSQSMMKIKQDSLMAALYARYSNEINERNSLALDSYIAFGSVQNKADGTFNGNAAHAKWDDSVVTLGTRFNWNYKMGEKTILTPFIGMDFVNGQQESFSQAYGSGVNQFYNGKMQTWTVPVGVSCKTDVALGGSQFLTPEFTVAYAGDLNRRDPRIRTNSFGEQLDIDGVSPGRNAFIGNAGVRWTINVQWNVGVYYDVEYRSGMTNQGVNANLHYTF